MEVQGLLRCLLSFFLVAFICHQATGDLLSDLTCGPMAEDPCFVLYDFQTSILTTYLGDGTVVGSLLSEPRIRGIWYNPCTQRVFAFKNPIVSYNEILCDEQEVPNTSGLFADGIFLGSLEGDPFKKELYFLTNGTNVWKIGFDGSGFTNLVSSTDNQLPRGSKIDTDAGLLYWADSDNALIKTVTTDSNFDVTTVVDGNVNGNVDVATAVDIDVANNKLYWCSGIGEVFVFDMNTMVNTLLTNIGSRCFTLRFFNGHLYTAFREQTGVLKLDLQGNLVDTLIDGQLGANSVKYFNLLVKSACTC